MDIACPTCAATYDIDDGSVSDAGRKVRCAACGTIWRAFRDREAQIISAPAPVTTADLPQVDSAPPMAPSEEDIAVPPPEDGPPTEQDAPPPQEAAPAPRRAKLVKPAKAVKTRRAGRLKGLLAWPVLVIAFTIVLAAGGFALREHVVRLAPQSAVVFAAAGAPVNLRGIDIRDVKSRLVTDNGVNVLVIDGNLVSISRDKVTVPRLRLAVLGDRGQEIYVWSAQADRPTLQPGETLNFRRRLAAPPADGVSVGVRFLSASDMTAGVN